MNPANNAIRAKKEEHADFKEHLRVIGNQQVSEEKQTDSVEAKKDDAKIENIAWHFREIMKTLELNLSDDSLRDTPERVAKMYVKEVFQGLDPKNKPSITLFDNKYQYQQMLVEKDIKVHSFCEHHFVPILGKAHVAYISSGKVIGLSKINRIVDYFARRPQVQERMTEQIAKELKIVLETEDVAVMIEADHMCVVMRGVQDEGSSTTTSSYHGKFKEREYREDFMRYVFHIR